MIHIGEFTIVDETEYTHGGIWMGREGGEGMQVTGESLEELKKLLDEFWEKHF